MPAKVRIAHISAAFLFIALITAGGTLRAQYFGQNKIKRHRFDFTVVQSPHFELYHYLQDSSVVLELLNASERWYRRHQEVLQDTFKTRNPIIFYSNHADFQQTNTIFGDVSVGTGGVTEGLKNRVVMPIHESWSQTDHVLGHELVHAFQYHLLRSNDSLGLSAIRNLPLWMVEGMAEYMSIGYVDSHTAMWMRDAILNDRFPTLEKMTRSSRYFPYRYGQAFWAYVTGIWGDDIIAPLFLETAKFGYSKAIQNILGFTEVQLSEMWKSHFKEFYLEFAHDTDSVITGTRLISHQNAGNLNIAPVISPDGNFLVYLSEKDVFSIDLFLADARSGRTIRKLYTTSRQGHLDDLSYIESAGTWSPSGEQFAFVGFGKGLNQLVIVDLTGKKADRQITIPGLPAFVHPSWSPDGESIALSGLNEGRSDLYLYYLGEDKLSRLTFSNYPVLQPTWSPDGNYIVYVSERPQNGKFSGYRLVRFSMISGTEEVLEIFPGADNVNPQYSPDGNSIYFLSNKDGFRNLYRYEFESRNVYQLTNYFTGISGITTLSPALSISQRGKSAVYNLFLDGRYEIIKANLDEFREVKTDREYISMDAAILPPSLRLGKDIVLSNLKQPGKFPAMEPEEINYRPYSSRFELDHLSQAAGVGVNTGRFGTGLAGSINALFSDMLGDNQLFAGLAMNGEIYDFGGQIAFVNTKNKVQVGASLSHVPIPAFRAYWKPDTITLNGDTLAVSNFVRDVYRTFQSRASLFAFFPVSKSLRFEAGASFTHYGFRRDRFNNYMLDGTRVIQNREQLPTPDGFNLQQIDVAYVGDNARFGLAAPMQGFRHRISAEKYFGNLDLYNFLVDYRKYYWVNPFNISFRLMHQSRYGPDAGNGILPPLAVFWPTLVRGYDWNTLYRLETTKESFNSNDLLGSRMLVGNLEFRLPFTGPKPLALIKSGILLSDLNLFLDGGVAWGNWNREIELSSFFEDQSTGNDLMSARPIFSTGVSMRVNFFGAMVVEPFYGIPLQGKGFRSGSFGVNLIPGW